MPHDGVISDGLSQMWRNLIRVDLVCFHILVGIVWLTTPLAGADFFPRRVDIPTISNSGKMFRELVPDLEESTEKIPCLWSHG